MTYVDYPRRMTVVVGKKLNGNSDRPKSAFVSRKTDVCLHSAIIHPDEENQRRRKEVLPGRVAAVVVGSFGRFVVAVVRPDRLNSIGIAWHSMRPSIGR